LKKHYCSGATCGGATPDPIPNSAVKPACAENTWTFGPGKIGQRRNNDAFLFEKNKKTFG
jgi:hypothetical protein